MPATPSIAVVAADQAADEVGIVRDPEQHASRAWSPGRCRSAVLAERAGAPPALVLAALLHDVGHLLEQDVARGTDGLHERLGARYLNAWFSQAVVAPEALHVDAKRYLVATDPSYAACLSDSSRGSLALQGGPFSRTELQRFESSPHAEAAVRLRRWDDAAKVAGIALPPLRSFGDLMRNQMNVIGPAANSA